MRTMNILVVVAMFWLCKPSILTTTQIQTMREKNTAMHEILKSSGYKC